MALPAGAAFEERLDAAERGRVRDDRGRLFHCPRVARDVEREQAAEGAVHPARGERVVEAGVADALDARVAGQAAGELERACRLAADAELQRPQAAEEEPGRVGRGDDPRACAESAEAVGRFVVGADDRAEEDVGMAGEELRRAVEGEVGAVLERPEQDRRRGRGVDDERRRVRGRRLEVGEGEERVRRRLDPHEVGLGGRCGRLVELDVAEAPALELAERLAGAVVGAGGERDRRARPEKREDERRGRGRARGKEQRVAAVELAEQPLGLLSYRMGVALVVRGPRLAVGVGRRTVERRRGSRALGTDEPRGRLHAAHRTRAAAAATAGVRPRPRPQATWLPRLIPPHAGTSWPAMAVRASSGV